MKKLLLTLLAVAFYATPLSAAPYVSGSIGLASFANSDSTYGGITKTDMIAYKSGVPFAGAVGIKSGAYRIEVALGYQSDDIDTVKRNGVPVSVTGYSVSTFSYMLNGYYNLDIKGSGLSPYLTAGIGGSSLIEKGGSGADETTGGLAWQLGAGVGIRASEHITVDLGYRYFRPSAYNANFATDITALSHNVMAGVRYGF